jgi:uncharacterized protein
MSDQVDDAEPQGQPAEPHADISATGEELRGQVVPTERGDSSALLPLGRWSPVDPAHQKLMHWTAAIRSLIFISVLGVATIPLWDSEHIPEGWWWLPPAILILAAGALAFPAWYWPPKAWEALRFRVDETGIEIRSGVWWQSSTIVACSRIQHTEVVRGPLQRSQNLATLVIHTAGNASDTVGLPGLRNEVAQALRDWLIAESASARPE